MTKKYKFLDAAAWAFGRPTAILDAIKGGAKKQDTFDPFCRLMLQALEDGALDDKAAYVHGWLHVYCCRFRAQGFTQPMIVDALLSVSSNEFLAERNPKELAAQLRMIADDLEQKLGTGNN